MKMKKMRYNVYTRWGTGSSEGWHFLKSFDSKKDADKYLKRRHEVKLYASMYYKIKKEPARKPWMTKI